MHYHICQKKLANRQTDRHQFHGLLATTTWVSRHQKGQTNLGRDSQTILTQTYGISYDNIL